MGDLVVLRNLIRAVSARGQSVEADSIFRKVAFEIRPTSTPRWVAIDSYSNVLPHARPVQ